MTAIVEMDHVSFRRGNRTILHDICWAIHEREHWAILGLNGSGKTSLLNIVAGYHYPTKGTVSVLGERFGQTNLPKLRKQIGFVSSFLDQFHETLASETVEHIVASGKFATIGLYDDVTKEDREQADELLTALRMSHLKDAPYHTLSQGEKRKALIARALMAKPRLLILDEPTVGLDLFTREELLASIRDMIIRNQCHILYVTHYIEEIMEGITHVLLLKDGQIVAAGRKEEVLTDPYLSETFQLHIHIHWEHNRPWVSIGQKNVWPSR